MLNVLVALGYYFLGRLSQLTVHGPTGPTAIWLPSGYALAMILIFGKQSWRGVAIGSLLSLIRTHGASAPSVLVSVLADTLEPLLAVYLLERFTSFSCSFSRLRDVLSFFVAGAFLSSAVSATIGVSGGRLSGAISSGAYPWSWWSWFVANMLSDLILTPFILAWSAMPLNPKTWRLDGRKLAEIAVGGALGSIVIWYVFVSPPGSKRFPLVYCIYPFLIWLAIRFGFRATVSGMFVVAGLAVWTTATGHGPFVLETAFENIAFVQSFLAVTAMTGMCLATAVNEQKKSEMERLRLIEELKGAVQVREDFLSIVSHELKTPITSLGLQLSLINRLILAGSISTLASDKQATLVKLSTAQIQRMTRLIDELQDLSRISAGKLQISPSEVDLAGLVQTVVERYATELKKTGSQLMVQLDTSILGYWDPFRVEQIFINLLTNAMKYGAGQPIEISTARSGQNAQLIVRDHGLGIAKSDQVRIFQKFERATSMRSYAGLGLGLYIVSEIVRSHGGSIKLDSELGRGSTFTVELPLGVSVRRAA